MIKVLVSGVAMAALTAGAAAAAPWPPSASSWIITPADNICRTEVELTGRSGAVTPVTLVSDGRQVAIRFTKEQVPERAFLPIRVDQKPYANLVLRTANPQTGEIVLSDETQAALRRGAILQIGWLAEEPVSASLLGSEQGVGDLRTCGAQVSAQYRAREAALQDAKARAEVETRAQAVADEQLATAKAQRQAAEADAQRRLAAVETERRLAEAERQRTAALAESDDGPPPGQYPPRYLPPQYQPPQYEPPPPWAYRRPY
ncbi:MAG: hypothetical protein ABI655_00510 [Phenylobacterium sp.]